VDPSWGPHGSVEESRGSRGGAPFASCRETKEGPIHESWHHPRVGQEERAAPVIVSSGVLRVWITDARHCLGLFDRQRMADEV